MENKHLPYGGSTAERTLNCPRWVTLAENVPKPPPSIYADDGNLLHDCMEEYYLKGVTFDQMLAEGRTYGSATLSPEHEELFDLAVAATEDVLNKYSIDSYACEAFVQLIEGKVGGSIDLLGKSSSGRVAMVLDYKFGHNPVQVMNNSSLQFYMLCTLADKKYSDFVTGATRLVYVIIQPKVSTEPFVWETDMSSLMLFRSKWDEAYTVATSGNAKEKAGNHCRYCPVAPYCETKHNEVEQALMIDPKDKQKLTEALNLVSKLSSWIKEVESTALNELRRGVKIDGYKLVEKRATSKWVDTEKAEQELLQKFSEKIYKKEFLSPTQMGKIAKAEGVDISHLVKKESSGTTIAPESDKRVGLDISSIPENLVNLTANAR